jgi:hypothetical protein
MVFLRNRRHRAAVALAAGAAVALKKTREEKAVLLQPELWPCAVAKRRYENWKKKQKQKQRQQQKKDAAAHRCLLNNVLVELQAKTALLDKRNKYLRFAYLRFHLDYLRRQRLPKQKEEPAEDEQPVVVVIECNESFEGNESFECNDSVEVEYNESVEYTESFETVLVDCQPSMATEVFAKLGNVVSVQVMAPETEDDRPSTVSSTKKYEETLLYSAEKRLSGKRWRKVERRRLMNAADWRMSRRVNVDRALDTKQQRDAWKRKRRMDRLERRQPAKTDAEWKRCTDKYNANKSQDSGMHA